MPFGIKPQPAASGSVDFDAVYGKVIQPAIEDAGMEALRADEEQVGGIIHKPMFERLILSEYAVADLTTANANVFYELGVRHAVKPFATILMLAKDSRLPFDLGPLRALPYDLDSTGVPADAEAAGKMLTEALRAARTAKVDSPVFQLLEGFGGPRIDIERLRTDSFRERVDYSKEVKEELAVARSGPKEEREAVLDTIRQRLEPIADLEAGITIDLFLSYRTVEAFDKMIELAREMAEPMRRTTLVQEQLGFALNRARPQRRGRAGATKPRQGTGRQQ